VSIQSAAAWPTAGATTAPVRLHGANLQPRAQKRWPAQAHLGQRRTGAPSLSCMAPPPRKGRTSTAAAKCAHRWDPAAPRCRIPSIPHAAAARIGHHHHHAREKAQPPSTPGLCPAGSLAAAGGTGPGGEEPESPETRTPEEEVAGDEDARGRPEP
jgi:hypothetical protein